VTVRVLAALPAAAACLAEGAWIAVIGALWSVAVPEVAPVASVWWLSALVAVGLIVGRLMRQRGTRRENLVAGAIAVVAGLCGGVLVLPLSHAAAAGSWFLAALAVWRGTRHRDRGNDDLVTSDLLRLGLPGLAVPWIAGAATAGGRDTFVAAALPATLLFVAASLVAVGLSRLEALSVDSGLDWASNRAWLFLLGGIVAGLALVSVPATLVLGAPLGDVVRGLLGPVVLVVDLARSAVGAVLTATGIAVPPGAGHVTPATPVGALVLALPAWVSTALAVFVLALMAVGAAYVASRLRGTPRGTSTVLWLREERHLEIGVPRLSLPTLGRPWRGLARHRLHSVTDAYLVVLGHLATRGLGRAGDESPRAHARRVRSASGWRLGFLAADYELERYARRPVTSGERRRALTRARWLRRR
jgi:hypothetical protein